jgi:hypothetical protein
VDDLIDHPAFGTFFLAAIAALGARPTLTLPWTLHWTLHLIS